MIKYIKCGTLIEATGAAPMKNKAIVVERDTIVAIADDRDDPPGGAEVIDLSRYPVMPGMIDAHEHLMLDVGDEAAQCAQPLPYLAMVAVANAKKILHSGISTMRDV